MKKTMKKIFASVIAAAMVLTAAPLSGIAQLDFSGIFAPEVSALNVSGSCGENVTYTFDASKLLVTISGTGPMTDYSPESYSPFSDYAGTIYVVIEDGVTSIGDYAFYGSDMHNIEIPDSVVRIGDYAAGNGNFERINIPKNVTYIGEHSFEDCPELAIITVDADNSVYDSRNNCNAIIETATNTLICGCRNTIIPDSVTGIGAYAFCGSGLTDIAIPSSVTSIGDSAFERCYDLSSIDISNGVTSIGAYAFDHTGFTNITIPDSVTGIGAYAFCGSKLTDIAIPDSVTSISDGAFEYCRRLANVTIPDSVTDIGENAFKNCYALTSIAIPDSVTSIGDCAFEQCESLTDVTLSDNITNIGKSLFENCLCLTSIIIPDGVTGIEENAFKNCNTLTSLEIPDSVTSIEASVFEGCTGLKKVNITSIAAWSVIDFENGLSNPLCYAQKLYLNNELVTDLIIPDSVTGISNFAYSGCTDLTGLTIPDSVTSIGDYAFRECEGLTNVTIPDSVTVIGKYAFYHCLGLKNITLPSGVTCIDRYAFCYCPNLTEITIPNSVTSIGEFAFSSCYYLTGIVIPDSVTVIDSFAFYECASITSVTIGENVESIGRYAFCSCNKIKDVYFSGSRSQWAEINIGIYNDTLLNAAIHYGKEDTSGALSDTVSYTYDKDTGVLTISGTGAIPTYVSASASPFAGREFSEIIIEEGITEIGSYAFPNCDIGTLTTPITLDNVKDNAFAGSTADNIIVNYYLGEDSAFDVGETGNEMLADPGSFEEYVYEIVTDTITACYNGKTMVLTYSGTGAIPDYSSEEWGTFSGTGEVHSVVFEEGITHIGDYSLVLCNGIESIILPDSLESIGEYAFALDAGLKTVTIGKNLTEIGLAAFTGCYSLEAFNVSADNTAFCSVDGVLYSKDRKELVLYPAGKEDTESEIPAGTETLCAAAFAECDNLTKVTIPTSVTEIDKGVFNGMDALTDVYYLGTQAEWENITMGDSNTSLRDVTMHYAVGGQLTDTTSWIYNETTQTLTITGTGDCKYDFNYDGETNDFAIKNVVFDTETYNGGYELVFEDLCNAESFRFTSTVTNINISEETHNFCYFYELETIYVDEDNALYESIDGVLFDSVNKKLLVYPAGRSESVYSVPEGTVSIGEVAFYGADMDEVILPDSLIILDYLAFFSCGINRIDLNNVKEVGRQAFLFNESISEVSFGESLESIKSEAFHCTALTNAVIPASVKELQINSFSSLKLESVTFKEGFDFITDEYDDSYVRVFDVSVISRLYLPSSITNIPYGLFCDAEITDVYYNGTPEQWARIEIGEGNEALENAEIHFAKIGGKLSDTIGWTYDEATKTLTFRGTGSLPYDYTYSGETYDFEIKTIVYDEGITELFCIPAFSNKGAAEIINISSTVENAEYNYGYDFDSLKEINVAEGNSNYCSIDGVLYSADKTVLVAYPNGKEAERFVIPESVTNFELMALANCKGITELVFSGNVKNIGMEDCRDSGFEKVDLYGVETIGSQAFFECENLTEVVFYDSLREIGGEAFGECSIDNVVIPAGTVFYATSFEGFCFESFTLADGYDFNIPPRDAGYNGFAAKNLYIPSSVTKIPDNFFYDCGFDDIWFDGTAAEWAEIEIGIGNEALENAEIHFAKIGGKLSETVGWTYDEDTETLTICGTGTYDPYKFKGEKYDFEIKHIVYDEGITEYFYLGNIFENIYNVETLHLASTVTGGFTNYDGSYGSIEFDVMTGLEDITVAEGNPAFCSVEGVMFNSDKTVILAYSNHGRTSYTIPETVTKITACFQRSGLEEIIFTGNVKEITVEAFWASEQLVRADLTGVEEIDDMAFMWCENLSEVIFDDNLKYIGHEAFTDCAFTEIVIPAGMEYFTSSSFNTMGFDTFRFEEGFDFDPETDYRSGCGFVAKEMYIPSSVTNIPEKFMNDETCAKKIYYNGTMAEWKAIDIGTDNDGILYSEIVCTDGTLNQLNPNAFYIFDDETGTLTISGEGEFRRIERPWIDYESDNCSPFAGDSSIKTLVVEEGITLLGDGLFDRCSGIREVYLPESLEEINDNTFFGCMWITDVYYNGTAAEWANIRIAESNYDLVNANIHFLGDVVAFTEDSGIEVQTVDGVTYVNGFNPGTTVDEISAMTEEGWTVSVETADGSDRIGTGSVITMTNGDVTVEYVAVVYGDTTGDSWYDGQDALITSCMVNGMLDETTAGAAVTSAADCNHDGVVDDLDVEILRQAGVLLASVDQTKSEEELITTSSAYVEYLNLIDQTIETDTAVETEVVEDTPTAEDEPVSINWFEMIVSFLKMLLNFVYGLFIL